ncbi:hypothetical protein FOL47_002183 [Perkinsus chesapeaki]|uniref:Uncharacterized protein n=1 Tax=Perkinsus chesapeaki TaxID=330153 RepID=A0A7J6MGM0_PERCH|nr:hypothetical protein FOL47_002183 [Perkinsus chesapeaki]
MTVPDRFGEPVVDYDGYDYNMTYKLEVSSHLGHHIILYKGYWTLHEKKTELLYYFNVTTDDGDSTELAEYNFNFGISAGPGFDDDTKTFFTGSFGFRVDAPDSETVDEHKRLFAEIFYG